MVEFIINLLLAGIEALFYLPFTEKKSKKTIKGCIACHELKNTNHIADEKQLTLAIRKIRKQIAVCSFKEIIRPSLSASGDFLKLAITAPWPGSIEHHFKCNDCKNRYRFLVETNSSEGICGWFKRY